MKSIGSVVTYLIFEFFIPAVCIVQTAYENALLNIKYGASQLYLGVAQIQLLGPGCEPRGVGPAL